MKVDPLLTKHREEIIRIAAKHGVKNVRVFEEFPGDASGPESDIDLLVDIDPLKKVTPWFPGGLMVDLADLLGKEVFVTTTGGLHPLLRDRILKEAIPLE